MLCFKSLRKLNVAKCLNVNVSSISYRSNSKTPLRVLVTGGSNGIGRCISELFASKNSNVLCVDINENTNKDLKYSNCNIEYITGDITDPLIPIECINYMINKWNGIDILINNAAIQIGNGIPIHELDESIWDKTLSVNLTSYFRFSKYFIKQILVQNELSNNDNNNLYKTKYNIINIASVQGIQSEKGVSAYTASKGAVLSLTKIWPLNMHH